VVLHDTPGVVAPSSLRGTRHEHRVRSAWNTAAEADLLVFLIDAHRQVGSAAADLRRRIGQPSAANVELDGLGPAVLP
jgi:GTPase Era involved in 16S rRNA processing